MGSAKRVSQFTRVDLPAPVAPVMYATARRNLERHIAQYIDTIAIAERHARERHLAPRPRECNGVRGLRHVGRLVQERECALRTSQ